MGKIWALGDAVVDLIPDDTDRFMDRFIKCAGGAPANVAVAAARLGGDCGFIGAVGGDPIGHFLRDTLNREGVDTDFMITKNDQRSSVVIVDLDDQGDRSFTFMVRPSADQFLTMTDLPTFNPGDYLHLCSIALANEPVRSAAFTAMASAKIEGALVSFDPNLRPDVWASKADMRLQVNAALALTDVIKVSTEELAWLTSCTGVPEGLQALWKQCDARLIMVTLGSDGVLCQDSDRLWRIPSVPVDVVDTTGAGDAFIGALLYGLARESCWPDHLILDAAIRQACLCGALATTAKGAMTALPSRAALERLQK